MVTYMDQLQKCLGLHILVMVQQYLTIFTQMNVLLYIKHNMKCEEYKYFCDLSYICDLGLNC